MNNNRNQNNNNNRRRGRGNRNQGGGGGGNQGNRIDSRARGNAPQMLDKYRKLAQDAQHHGDRVQAEYYLQFADHYFRVIADNNRGRQDEPRSEQRPGRRDEQDEFEIGDQNDGDDRFRFDSRDRDNRERDGQDRDARERDGRERDGRETQSPEREGRDRDVREVRPERPRRNFRRGEQSDATGAVEASEGPPFEPEDNPFVREASEPRAERPKRRAPRARGSNDQESEGDTGIDRGGIDAAALPSFLANDAKAADEAVEDAAPRPRRKRSGGGTLSAVG